MRQGWERDKDRKRGMVGERKIGRERGRRRQGLDKDRKGDMTGRRRG